MANGVQLATAYISLNVRTDDIKKQVDGALRGVGSSGRAVGSSIGSNLLDGIRSHMGSGALSTMIFAPMELAGVRWAARAGATIGGVLKKAIMGAASLTGIGSIFAVGGVLSAGLDRLKTLQASTVQLRLKLSPEEIKKVQQDIADVVTGTPIALDQAMQAVPKAISAGLRGDAVKQYVKDIADLTAATGGQGGGYQQSFDRLAIVMDQIRSKGKLAGEEILQLVDAGVDVRGLLKEGMGWDDKTLNAKLKANKVGINDLQKSIQKVYGTIQAKNGKTGLAQQIGETFEGAIGALKTSAARLGANLIAAIVGKKANEDPLKDFALGIGEITTGLNNMGKWVDENREGIHTTFKTAGAIIGWVADKVGKLGDVFRNAKQFGIDAGTWIANTWTSVSTKLGTVKTKIEEVFNTVKDKFSDVFGENGWFAEQFKKLGELVDKVRDILGLGPATANAGAVPFNPGPMAPGAYGNYPGRANLAPGTRLDGSDQRIAGVPGLVPPTAAVPSGYVGDSALIGKIPKGRYVTAEEFRTGNVTKLGDLTLGLGDCTSAIEDLVALIEGGSTAGRSMATGNAAKWAADNGFLPTDVPVPGAFQIGFNGHHMQATLPGGTPFNYGSNEAAAVKGMDGSLGAWDPSFTQHYYKKYGSGGSVWGQGTATSDSIPAMLSNGEHVLNASDVKKMGGQRGVYAFRNALQAGMIPGFAPGGPVDPSVIQDTQNSLADAQKASEIAQAQFNEVMNNPDATEIQKVQAQVALNQALRNAQQLAADYPIIASGGTPPDRSVENGILSSTDQLQLAQLQLANLPEDASYSAKLQAQAAVDQAQRSRDQGIAAYNQKNAPPNFLDEFRRAGGFVPTAAGNTGIAGTSSLAGVINMGNDVVSGLIDTGASLAQTAVSAAATAGAAAGTAGAGAAAGPAAGAAASWGIQTAANVGKRLSSYGFQLASIGADSLIAQMFPFGAPRWLGYDYTQFAPQAMMGAATTTLEKMGSNAIQKAFNPQGGNQFQIPGQPQAPSPASPEAPLAGPPDGPQPLAPTQGLLQQGDPGFVDRNFDPNALLPGGGGGSWAKGGAIRIYDSGGVLKPGDLALNASNRPEKILTQKQWDSLGNLQPGGRDAPLVKIDTIYGMNPDDVANKIESKQKLAMMRYAGRP